MVLRHLLAIKMVDSFDVLNLCWHVFELVLYFEVLLCSTRVGSSYIHDHKTECGTCTLQYSAGHIYTSTGSIRFSSTSYLFWGSNEGAQNHTA